MDNSEDREGYSLACGFSLGLVLLGMGNENLPGLDDLKLSDRLVDCGSLLLWVEDVGGHGIALHHLLSKPRMWT